jgi:hypothetical protein
MARENSSASRYRLVQHHVGHEDQGGQRRCHVDSSIENLRSPTWNSVSS